uniref:Trafficking protein particle complex subunit n=1 Tax=Cebus imitator TaxID=2715852 RepID=A0A2K5R845_CEBIM
MAIFSVYVMNKPGGLIYQLDSYTPRAQAEKTSSYPLDLLLKLHDERVWVAFVGHAVLAIGGMDVNSKYTSDRKEVLDYLGKPANYPKLMLASMFHSLFAIGSQLSGIKTLETDTFKMHCQQTLIGIKFRQGGRDSVLRKIYAIYSGPALKNPFYSLEMPIRSMCFCESIKPLSFINYPVSDIALLAV